MGIDRTSLEKLDGILQEALEKKELPGLALGVVRGNSLVYCKAFGVRNIETREPPDFFRRRSKVGVMKIMGRKLRAKVDKLESSVVDRKEVNCGPSFRIFVSTVPYGSGLLMN